MQLTRLVRVHELANAPGIAPILGQTLQHLGEVAGLGLVWSSFLGRVVAGVVGVHG